MPITPQQTPISNYAINIKRSHAIVYRKEPPPIFRNIKGEIIEFDKTIKATLNYIELQLLKDGDLFNDPIYHYPDLQFYLTKPPEDNKRKELSEKSSVRIKHIVNLLVECSILKTVTSIKEKFSFQYKTGLMTLTLPEKQKHTDQYIHYNIFKPFIRRMKEQYNLAEYLWKAEAQDNGNIHYHLTLNVFIHHSNIKIEWNKQLSKHGYRFKSDAHYNATTQIKATWKVRNLGAYLCKYLSKGDRWKKKTPKWIIEEFERDEKNNCYTLEMMSLFVKWMKRNIEIKLWDCSENLKNKKLTVTSYTKEHHWIINDLIDTVIEIKQTDYCEIWIIDPGKFENKKLLKWYYDDWIKSIRYADKQKENYTVESIMPFGNENIIFAKRKTVTS